MAPNFSPYPFAALPRVSKRDAALVSALARWVIARPLGAKVAALAGGAAHVRLVGVAGAAPAIAADPHAALAEVRLGGQTFVVGASSRFARELAQRVLYGPDELSAPRPLTQIEHAVFALAVAAALEDTTLAGEVWPVVDAELARARLGSATSFVVELVLEVAGGAPVTVVVWCPIGLPLATPPARPWPAWDFEVPVQLGSCALRREDLAALRPRDVVTIASPADAGRAAPPEAVRRSIDRRLALAVGEGLIELSAAAGAVEARVASDYVPRDMALPDDAHVELTVQLGTTRLSLRQLSELAVGAIVPLGRPLAGPFEIRAAGRSIGQGELVDIEGELGVRIVSLQE